MNQRIQELAEQVGFTQFEALDERIGKFAELIVRECSNEIIKQNSEEVLDDWDRGYVSGLQCAFAMVNKLTEDKP